jgi:hypothetical protein
MDTVIAGRPWFQHAMVGALALVLGLSYGLSYGMETQTTYLLYPLRRLDPAFLGFDWLASQTAAYHKSFSVIIQLLSVLGPLPWAVAFANVALVAAFVLAIYVFLDACFKRKALVAILILMFLVVIDRTTSIADSHILTFRFEPSSVAACAVVIGLLLLIAGRYAWSGIFIAIGGFFHTNFLLLDFVFFGCAHLALGIKGIVRRGILQFTPSVLVVLHELPMLYAMATDPLGGDARHIMQFIRSPHHYVPGTNIGDFVGFAGWHLLAASCIRAGSRGRDASSMLARVYLAFTGVVIVATLLTTVVFVPRIAELLFLRMAPFSILLAQLIIATRIAADLDSSRAHHTVTLVAWRLATAVFGGVLLLSYHIREDGPLDTAFMAMGMALGMIAAGSGYWPGLRAWAARGPGWIKTETVFIGLLVPALVLSAAPPTIAGRFALSETSPFYKRFNLLVGEPVPLRELYAWARSTDPASQFLIPPNIKSFRVFAGRAVVVDWQSTPILPVEVLEWYRRIGRVSGAPDVKSVKDAETGYARMDRSRLRSLAGEYGVDYAIFRKPFDVQQVDAEVVFENTGFLAVRACDESAKECGSSR